METESDILMNCVQGIGAAADADACVLPWISSVVMDMRRQYIAEYSKSDGFHLIMRHAERLLERAHARRRLVPCTVRTRILACICLAHSMQDDQCYESCDTAYKKHLSDTESRQFVGTVTRTFFKGLDMNAHVDVSI